MKRIFEIIRAIPLIITLAVFVAWSWMLGTKDENENRNAGLGSLLNTTHALADAPSDTSTDTSTDGTGDTDAAGCGNADTADAATDAATDTK